MIPPCEQAWVHAKVVSKAIVGAPLNIYHVGSRKTLFYCLHEAINYWKYRKFIFTGAYARIIYAAVEKVTWRIFYINWVVEYTAKESSEVNMIWMLSTLQWFIEMKKGTVNLGHPDPYTTHGSFLERVLNNFFIKKDFLCP